MNRKQCFIQMVRYLKPYKGKVVIALIGTVIAIARSMLSPYLVEYGVSLASANSFQEILKPLLFFCTINVCTWGIFVTTTLIRYRILDRVLNRVDKSLREDIFRHCLELSHRYYDDHRIGTLISTISHDVTAIREVFYVSITDGLEKSFKLVLIFVVFGSISLPMVAIVLPITCITICLLWKFGNQLYDIRKKNRKSESRLIDFVEDRLGGIRTIIGFGMETREMKKYKNLTNDICHSEDKKYAGYMKMALTRGGYENILYDAVLIGGIIMAICDIIDISELVAVYSSLWIITEAIYTLIPLIRSYQESTASFERISEILNTKPDIPINFELYQVPAKLQGHIIFKNVSFSYNGGDEILSNVSFVITPGEYIAIVGDSGEGKSTISKLIPRYYDVTGGNIYIDGLDIREYNPKVLRKQIGVVSQDVYLFADTVLENIRFAKPTASFDEVKRAACIANADGFISNLPDGYDSYVGERGVKLSGGQRQRIAIARCVLADTPIMIFDEATSSLDIQSECQIQAAIDTLSGNRTIIVIAHRLSTIENADRFLYLKDGHISEISCYKDVVDKMAGSDNREVI